MIHVDMTATSGRRFIFFDKSGYKGGWEINLVGRSWSLRIAQHQVALWYRYHVVLGWLSDRGLQGIWQEINLWDQAAERPS